MARESRPPSKRSRKAAGPSALPPLREAAFQRQVIELAQLYGWLVAHFRTIQTGEGPKRRYLTPVQADGAGFPDLVLVRERVVVAELKSDTGRVRPDQRVWLERFEAAGIETHVWRPRDFEEIHAALRPAA